MIVVDCDLRYKVLNEDTQKPGKNNRTKYKSENKKQLTQQ